MKGRKIVRKYRINSPYKHVVNTTRYKRPAYTARALFKTPTLLDATLKEVASVIRHECDTLCAIVPVPSLFRSPSVEGLKTVHWDVLFADLKIRAPVLLSILTAAVCSSKEITTSSAAQSVYVPIIVMAAAVLLKGRSKKMCRIQAMIGVLLFIGHASKRVN